MAATLFYLDPLPEAGAVAVLDGKEGRHAATVRRIAVGERLVLSDGRGHLADVEVTATAKDRLEARVLARREVPAPRPRVTVVQALPKSDRSELAVELATDPFGSLPLAAAAELLLVVGPEGGVDDAELAALTTAGARPVLLGPTVLRTSTAAAVALGAVGVLTPRWDARPLH